MTDFINNIPTVEVKRRKLRRYQTDAEALLWKYLRSRKLGGYKFYRQFSVGMFILDFYCDEVKLGVEIDGGSHKDKQEYDYDRTIWFNNHHIRIIRFWNNEVIKYPDRVCEIILSIIERK